MPRKNSKRKTDVYYLDFTSLYPAMGAEHDLPFKKNGTRMIINDTLLNAFPVFEGYAPVGHPYPQAFTDGAVEPHCFVQRIGDLVLLRHKLPNGRIISIDTCDFDMLNGGFGIAHLNMDNGDNRVHNLKWVDETEARKMLLEFVA